MLETLAPAGKFPVELQASNPLTAILCDKILLLIAQYIPQVGLLLVKYDSNAVEVCFSELLREAQLKGPGIELQDIHFLNESYFVLGFSNGSISVFAYQPFKLFTSFSLFPAIPVLSFHIVSPPTKDGLIQGKHLQITQFNAKKSTGDHLIATLVNISALLEPQNIGKLPVLEIFTIFRTSLAMKQVAAVILSEHGLVVCGGCPFLALFQWAQRPLSGLSVTSKTKELVTSALSVASGFLPFSQDMKIPFSLSRSALQCGGLYPKSPGGIAVASIPNILKICHDLTPLNYLKFDDSRECLSARGLPPLDSGAGCSLAIVTDNLGRLSLICTITLRVLQMWKGYRNAAACWFYSEHKKSFVLAIYAPLRGLLELWDVFDSNKRFSARNVGMGCSLLSGFGKASFLLAPDGRLDILYLPVQLKAQELHFVEKRALENQQMKSFLCFLKEESEKLRSNWASMDLSTFEKVSFVSMVEGVMSLTLTRRIVSACLTVHRALNSSLSSELHKIPRSERMKLITLLTKFSENVFQIVDWGEKKVSAFKGKISVEDDTASGQLLKERVCLECYKELLLIYKDPQEELVLASYERPLDTCFQIQSRLVAKSYKHGVLKDIEISAYLEWLELQGFPALIRAGNRYPRVFQEYIALPFDYSMEGERGVEEEREMARNKSSNDDVLCNIISYKDFCETSRISLSALNFVFGPLLWCQDPFFGCVLQKWFSLIALSPIEISKLLLSWAHQVHPNAFWTAAATMSTPLQPKVREVLNEEDLALFVLNLRITDLSFILRILSLFLELYSEDPVCLRLDWLDFKTLGVSKIKKLIQNMISPLMTLANLGYAPRLSAVIGCWPAIIAFLLPHMKEEARMDFLESLKNRENVGNVINAWENEKVPIDKNFGLLGIGNYCLLNAGEECGLLCFFDEVLSHSVFLGLFSLDTRLSLSFIDRVSDPGVASGLSFTILSKIYFPLLPSWVSNFEAEERNIDLSMLNSAISLLKVILENQASSSSKEFNDPLTCQLRELGQKIMTEGPSVLREMLLLLMTLRLVSAVQLTCKISELFDPTVFQIEMLMPIDGSLPVIRESDFSDYDPILHVRKDLRVDVLVKCVQKLIASDCRSISASDILDVAREFSLSCEVHLALCHDLLLLGRDGECEGHFHEIVESSEAFVGMINEILLQRLSAVLRILCDDEKEGHAAVLCAINAEHLKAFLVVGVDPKVVAWVSGQQVATVISLCQALGSHPMLIQASQNVDENLLRSLNNLLGLASRLSRVIPE